MYFFFSTIAHHSVTDSTVACTSGHRSNFRGVKLNSVTCTVTGKCEQNRYILTCSQYYLKKINVTVFLDISFTLI